MIVVEVTVEDRRLNQCHFRCQVALRNQMVNSEEKHINSVNSTIPLFAASLPGDFIVT